MVHLKMKLKVKEKFFLDVYRYIIISIEALLQFISCPLPYYCVLLLCVLQSCFIGRFVLLAGCYKNHWQNATKPVQSSKGKDWSTCIYSFESTV